MKPLQLFSEHPRSVGETYLEHLLMASSFAVRLLAGGFAWLVHAFLPFLFERTGSDCVCELHRTLTQRRQIAEGRREQKRA